MGELHPNRLGLGVRALILTPAQVTAPPAGAAAEGGAEVPTLTLDESETVDDTTKVERPTLTHKDP